MPLSTILIVSGIVAVFALFGIVLAWGDRQTRNLVRDQTPAAKDDREDQLKKAA
jgi:FtsZ-interacting cell division protein ZipA